MPMISASSDTAKKRRSASRSSSILVMRCPVSPFICIVGGFFPVVPPKRRSCWDVLLSSWRSLLPAWNCMHQKACSGRLLGTCASSLLQPFCRCLNAFHAAQDFLVAGGPCLPRSTRKSRDSCWCWPRAEVASAIRRPSPGMRLRWRLRTPRALRMMSYPHELHCAARDVTLKRRVATFERRRPLTLP